jgi:hypothetical protein
VLHQRLPQSVTQGDSAYPRQWLAFGAAALLITISLLFRGPDHDESQYVAAIALTRQGWPYLDFAYLQTPLQPFVLGFLAWLPAGWLFGGVRAVNSLFAMATLVVLCSALKQRASWRSTLIALAALTCTQAFLLAGSLARNDALPMLLIAGAIAALLRGIDGRSPAAFGLGGLLLGLATSAKISAAVPAAGAVLFLILRYRELGFRRLVWFGAGAAAGLLPCFIFALAAPSEFRFDVVGYSLSAPAQWWTSVGKTNFLQPTHRIWRLIELSVQGSILVALAAALFDRKSADDRLLLDLMIIGGAIGSYMPEPAYAQYLVPLLPPLFVRFALALGGAGRWWRSRLGELTVVTSILGVGYAGSHFAGGIAIAKASEVGPAVAVLARGGPVATLSPEWVAGTGLNLDPRFAAGPFLFRTTGAIADRAEAYGHAVPWQDSPQLLGERPPAVILVGGESKPHSPVHPNGLDWPLIAWATSHDYRPVRLDYGFVAYVSPAAAR